MKPFGCHYPSSEHFLLSSHLRQDFAFFADVDGLRESAADNVCGCRKHNVEFKHLCLSVLEDDFAALLFHANLLKVGFETEFHFPDFVVRNAVNLKPLRKFSDCPFEVCIHEEPHLEEVLLLWPDKVDCVPGSNRIFRIGIDEARLIC